MVSETQIFCLLSLVRSHPLWHSTKNTMHFLRRSKHPLEGDCQLRLWSFTVVKPLKEAIWHLLKRAMKVHLSLTRLIGTKAMNPISSDVNCGRKIMFFSFIQFARPLRARTLSELWTEPSYLSL